MTKLLAIAIDPALAGHIAVALRRHREALRRTNRTEPDGLADLEAFAVEVVSSAQQASDSVTVGDDRHAGMNDNREYLSRRDVSQLVGVSIATVDRWLGSGRLPSTRHGRIRRVARSDLDRFLGGAT